MKVARLPAKPLVIFDGNCNFCRFWIERAKQLGGEPMDYAPSQEVGPQYPELSEADFDRAVQLIEKDGTVLEGADACLRIVKTSSRWGWLARFILAFAPLLALSRWAYRHIAGNRMFFSKLTRWSWGADPAPSTYAFARRVFAHALGLVFFCAFASLAVQVRGLIGPDGVQPASDVLKAAHGTFGSSAYWLLPTPFWVNAGDTMLLSFAVLGMIVSLVLACGLWPGGCTLVLWAIYLGFGGVASPFLDLPADRLLLEAALPAALLLPWRLFPAWRLTNRFTTLGRWLLWWLLFRLFFESGVQKLIGGDPAFRGVAFMSHYYENQPLPTGLAWYLHQLPGWFHSIEGALAIALELLAPLTFLMPRRIRHLGGYAMAAQTVGLMLTGNFGFQPLLTLALTVLLLDDLHWPVRWRMRLLHRARAPLHVESVNLPNMLVEPLAGVAIFLTAILFLANLLPTARVPKPIQLLFAMISPLRSFTAYGPFYSPRGPRQDLIMEGSPDLDGWQPYELPYKPGNPWTRPAMAGPHLPRLDYLMAVAGRSTPERNDWIKRLTRDLLRGTPVGNTVFTWNPYRSAPPTFVRAMRYDYRFTRLGEGAGWWHREPAEQPWYGPMSLSTEKANIQKNLPGLIEQKPAEPAKDSLNKSP